MIFFVIEVHPYHEISIGECMIAGVNGNRKRKAAAPPAEDPAAAAAEPEAASAEEAAATGAALHPAFVT